MGLAMGRVARRKVLWNGLVGSRFGLCSGDLQSARQVRNGRDARALGSDQYLALAVDGSL